MYCHKHIDSDHPVCSIKNRILVIVCIKCYQCNYHRKHCANIYNNPGHFKDFIIYFTYLYFYAMFWFAMISDIHYSHYSLELLATLMYFTNCSKIHISVSWCLLQSCYVRYLFYEYIIFSDIFKGNLFIILRINID